MRRLILKMSISLDGFLCGPQGEIDWMFRSRDDAARDWVLETLWQAGLHAMGSRTFFEMARHWPASTDPLAGAMNQIPKAVFTRQETLDMATVTLRTAQQAFEIARESQSGPGLEPNDWAAATVVSGDLEAGIKRLKQQHGNDILAHGGASFAQSLAASGLVDEYRLLVHPVVLGKGQSLFAHLPKPMDLELRSTTLFRSGATAQVYRPL